MRKPLEFETSLAMILKIHGEIQSCYGLLEIRISLKLTARVANIFTLVEDVGLERIIIIRISSRQTQVA